MQKTHEASLGCLKIKASHHVSQESGNAVKGFPKPGDELNFHQSNIVEANSSFNRGALASPNQGYNRSLYQQEFFTMPNYIDIQMLRQNQLYPIENPFYPMNLEYNYPVENSIQYLPFKMFSQAHPHEVQYQEFQYFVVIDFEATCDKEMNPNPQEIIEFPSVIVNSATGQLESYFQRYVRPAYNQHLTDFCKELTGIQQTQVDSGVSLSEALLMHDEWLEAKGIKHKNFAVVTWSNWDCRVMLESECRLKRIRKPPYFNRWINLKVPFQEVFGGVRCNLKEAVQLSGLAWEGRAHCGLDDARNTARLLALLMRGGFRFSITNSMISQSTTDPAQPPQKPKELICPAVPIPHPFIDPIYCFCGVMSMKCVVRKPGPTQGRCFFGCGNWTAARRSLCNYFAWASP